MVTVTGIFKSADDAMRTTRRLQSVVSKDQITQLSPGDATLAPKSVEVISAEQPGMGKAMGGIAGAAVGIAGGVEVAAITAAVPGVGPVIALGVLGGALLGFLGARAGQAIDRAASEGLPEDEIFVYEDALRRGRTVLIISLPDEATAASVRKMLEWEGAEAVDAAREMWWIGLRSAEQEHYSQGNGRFERDEKFYRLGYEAALHAKYRCKEYDQILSEMQADLTEVQQRYPREDAEAPFLKGFERGRAYYQELCNKTPQ